MQGVRSILLSVGVLVFVLSVFVSAKALQWMGAGVENEP